MIWVHGRSISAIADTSSGLYRGRAECPGLGVKGIMAEGWRDRLKQAVEVDGRSMRDISLKAGLSHGYLQGVLHDGKDPGIDRFLIICREMGVSAAYIMLGINISAETEAVISALEDDGPRRAAVLALLGR